MVPELMEIGIRIRLSPWVVLWNPWMGKEESLTKGECGNKSPYYLNGSPCVGSGLVDMCWRDGNPHSFCKWYGRASNLILPIQKSEWGDLGHLAVRAVKVDMFLGRGISQCRELVAFFFFFCPIFSSSLPVFSHDVTVHLHLFPSFFLTSSSVSTTLPYLCLHQPFFSSLLVSNNLLYHLIPVLHPVTILINLKYNHFLKSLLIWVIYCK